MQEKEEELTREGLFATQFVYELTEDYANKHSWSEEVKESLQQCFGKLCGFVSNVFDKITGENVEGMAAVRPIAKIALKAGARSKAGKEFIGFLVRKLLEQGLNQEKINEVLGSMGVSQPSGMTGAESIDKYDDILPGIWERSSKKSSTSTPSRSNMNSGGGSAMPPDPEKDTKKERKGTDGYKMGQTWDSLKPVNKPEANQQIGKINKQAFGGGEMRTDGEKLYRFDNGHKNGKIHMEVYKKTSKGWQPYAECDPETGAILEGSLEEMAKREVISW